MAQLIVSQPKGQVSRDEMNLAEFPLAVLSTRSNAATKTLEFSDSVTGKNGEVVNRKWIITGADKFGLPTSSDDEVLLGLLKLTVDDGVRERKVHFTRYELLKILRWTTEGRSYSRLQKALDRLSGVRIKATNAFYDNDTKLHCTKNFGIIDAYEINDGRDANIKSSFFTWSDVLFKSFQVGFIKKLDLDFYLDLKSAVSKRLYRYLDKHFWYRSRMQLNLFVLAHEKIGISRNYTYASSIRQQLDPAIEELIGRGFISKCEYVGKGKDTEIVLYSGKSKVLPPAATSAAAKNEGTACAQDIARMLVERGIQESQIGAILAGKTEKELARIVEIVKHFDNEMKRGKIKRSPAGFLYYAVTNAETFKLRSDAKLAPAPKRAQSTQISMSMQDDKARMTEYLVARKHAIADARQKVGAEEEKKIAAAIETSFAKLRNVLSVDKLMSAVNVGVEERLLKIVNFPTYETWTKSPQR